VGAAMAEESPKRLTPAQARQKAEECRVLARTAQDNSHRIMLNHIAETWDRIADSAQSEH
jgi:hypothetical protein